MSIKYATLKQSTWQYRRHYPTDVKALLGKAAFKKSLRTSDAKLAASRVAELNLHFQDTVERIRAGLAAKDHTHNWQAKMAQTISEVDLDAITYLVKQKVEQRTGDLCKQYLILRQSELRKGGFKSVRYSVELFWSKYGDRSITSLDREDGRLFLSSIAKLSKVIGKTLCTRNRSLDELLVFSADRTDTICSRTQQRIWRQVNHFLDWSVYEGHLLANPFKTVRFEAKGKSVPYAVPTDDEVRRMLALNDPKISTVLLFCLLTGMRSGGALGLMRCDLIDKGNLGTFAHVQENDERGLKTDTADSLVPLHEVLEALLPNLPAEGPLFPALNVNQVTKAFADMRRRCGMARTGLVFHSTRKWFITQCERTGVPEHFTASLVGHASARSENKLTYSIYSAGISDEQKRGIIDQIRLPS